MARISLRVDDVALATKKTVTEADRTVEIKVPSYATPNGRAKTYKFDVGKDGEAELERLMKAARRKVEEVEARIDRERAEAWRPIVELEQRIRDARAERSGGRRKNNDESEQASAEQPSADSDAVEHGSGESYA